MSEEQVIESGIEESPVVEDVSDGIETPVEETPVEVSAEEKQEAAEDFIKLNKAMLPKGVETYVDQNGDTKFIVNVNGKKAAYSFENLVKGFNLNQAGYQMLNEGKQKLKAADDAFRQFIENPKIFFDFLRSQGKSEEEIEGLAESYLRERLELAQMTPEQLEMYKTKQELEELRQEKLRAEEEKKSAAFQAEVQKHQDNINKELPAAMIKYGFEKTDNKTKSKVMVEAIKLMQNVVANGGDMTCDDAVYYVKQDMQTGLMEMLNEVPANQIRNLVPEDFLKRVLDQRLSEEPVTPTGKSLEIGQYVDVPEEQVITGNKRKKQETWSDFFKPRYD